MLQKPKLAPYILEMREMLASEMDLDVERISVKATTAEKLGFVGRRGNSHFCYNFIAQLRNISIFALPNTDLL